MRTPLRAIVGVVSVWLACLSAGLAQSPPAEITIAPQDRLKVFDKTWETVNARFFDGRFNGVDWAAMKQTYRPLAEAAADKIELRVVLNRMLAELRVTHADVNNGIWFGTGINYVRFGQQYVVRLANTGSPAKAAGIEPGWLATAGSGDCDSYGRAVTNTFQDALGQLHHTEVPCEIIRGPGDAESPSVRMLNDTTVYLRFTGFDKKKVSWFENQVAAHRATPAMVIDLRGNGGGDAIELRNALKLFFAETTEFGTFRSRKGSDKKLKAGNGAKAYRGRVTVLVDAASYSAAEIFAAAMQETGRAVIVGRTTRGGVLGSDHFGLSNGFVLHLPIYDFRTSAGIRLEGRGVIPDEPVEVTLQDFREGRDPDLDRVIRSLRVNGTDRAR